MDIQRAKEEIKRAVQAYLATDDIGRPLIPAVRQRPILLMGPPGVGKTQIMEQIAQECDIALVAYTITHHTRQSAVGLPFIRERNYIENPKPNGYRSHHLILGVNVCCRDASEYYPVEIQLRTISMDFWAAMEHRVSYKKNYDNKEERVAELLRYSNTLEQMEKEFEKYNDHPIEM